MENKEVKVIIADDSISMRTYFKQIISEIGFNLIAIAENGQNAVTLVEEKSPDIILMDINMPAKTGIEALEEIMDIKPETIVIMLTSVSDSDVVKQCLDAGAENYIVKDTPKNEIIEAIKETWERNSFH